MDQSSLFSKVADLGLAVLAGVVLMFTKRSVKKFDDQFDGYGERIGTLERECVRESSLRLFRQQLAQEHIDNQASATRREEHLVRIEGSIVDTHKRVDDLFKMMAKRGHDQS